MIFPPEPANEKERIKALHSYRILDSEAEPGFDDLTALAASQCGTPIAMVSLVDTNRAWVKSCRGVEGVDGTTEGPREYAFCAYTILQKEGDPLVVADSHKNERFVGNPHTTSALQVRFYAGIPLYNSDGYALGALCVVDTIPRHLTLQQLETLRLLGRSAIAQLELRKSRDLARRMAEYRSTFLASMSHEVRAPLNGVLGVIQQLEETKLNGEQRELFEMARTSGCHLLGVVNDILDLSRLEASRIDLEEVPFHMQDLIREVIALSSKQIHEKNLKVSMEWISSQSDARIGDPHRIRQILLNLVSNAIKFTPSTGSIRIRVADSDRPDADNNQLQECQDPNALVERKTSLSRAQRLYITVQDSGIGIAPKVIGQLFQPFTQADCSTTRQYGGSGLGLAIVRHLVSLMRGKVSVTSTLGRGSQFTCALPLKFAPPSETRSTKHSKRNYSPLESITNFPSSFDAKTTATTLFDLGGRSVLLAEDDLVTVKLLKRKLLTHNCKLTVVHTGTAALELCRKASLSKSSSNEAADKFDLILMDGMMPEMGGYEATEKIRALPSAWAKSVPIIAMTGNALEGAREECFNAGMTDYMSKPISFQALNLMFERMFSSPESEEGAGNIMSNGADGVSVY